MKQPIVITSLLGILAVALPFQMASAQVIAVPDGTFSAPTTTTFQDNAGITTGSALPGTSNDLFYLGGSNGQGGASPVGVENTAANGAETGAIGGQDGYVNSGAFLGSAALTTIQANTTYTLTVDEAVRSNGYNETAGFTLALAGSPNAAGDPGLPGDFASSLHVSLATAQADGGTGAFVPYTTSFTTGSSGGFIGDNLFVVLASDTVTTAQNPVDFNNVVVTATGVVPEPSTYALLALGAGMLLVARRRLMA